jgi:hypothetical protein
MRKTLALLAAAAVAAPAAAADPTEGLKKGTPEVKQVAALAFGPSGILFVGDPQSATITAVATGDTQPGGKGDVAIDNLGEKLGSALGTTAENVAVADVKVNPASGNIFLAVTRGKGKDAAPVVVKLDRAGALSTFEMKDVPFAQVKLTNASDKNRQEAITGIAYLDGKVIVAGLSNEEFASTLRTIPFPFTEADKGAGIEIYHGAHGKLETNSPVRTFVPYKLSGTDYLVASYTCTPLVKIPVADLKAGAKVKGTTIAELGNGNTPLDMIVYTKGGKDYLLMANNARGVMKIPTAGFETAEPITSKAAPKTGIQYDTIAELTGVTQLDKLDADRALILIQDPPPARRGQPQPTQVKLTLKSIPLP